MIRIPTAFLQGGARTYETLVNKYENILGFSIDQENFAIYPQMVLFYEFVGNNAYMLQQMPTMLSRFNDSDIFLIIDDSYEGLGDKQFMEEFKTALEQSPCVTNWRILSSNLKMKDICNEVFGSTNNYLYYNIHVQLDQYDSIRVEDYELNFNDQLRAKKFMCLNRQERMHRLLTVDHLLEQDIAKHTFLSCMLGEYAALIHDDKDVEWSDEAKAMRKFLDPNLKNLTLTQDQKERLSCLPLELDVSESQHHAVKVNMPSLEEYFQQSYFSIITEGDFDRGESRQMFTEKVLKCFLHGHPFIVIGLPGTLEALHNMGFITFGSIIDESYDKELNDQKRLEMCWKEIDKLNALNMNELRNLYNSIKPILIHNYQTYKVLNSMPAPSRLANDLLNWYQGD
jgi:hypothetical protein